jgi:CHAT domain-containing protein/Tfp pilus assembly protein PilF
MMRWLWIATVMVMLTGGVQHSTGQPPPTASNLQAALQEAEQLNEVVLRLYREGKYREAEARAERALAFREQALGPRHPDVAESLNNLALLYWAQGAYANAEPLYVRALAIFEQALGPRHPDVATSLNNLALLYKSQGAYAKAEPLYVRALAIREQALGPRHPDVATSLDNLAGLYWAQGAYAKAEPLHVRAIAIFEQALGPHHPAVATSLSNLAALYQARGAYAKAEPLHVRALAIREQALGPRHPDVARGLDNLAGLYWAQGAYAKAEPLHVRALAIFEQALGPRHPDVATSLSNLAGLYWAQGAYAKAEPLYVRALAIREQAQGPSHPDVATSLSNLAGLYCAQGAYAKAEPLHVRALAIFEQALGPRHPDVATSLNNLAGLYDSQGAYAKAEPLSVRALPIFEQALGPSHPAVAKSLNNLALLYWSQGSHAKAEPLWARATDIAERQLRAELERLSELRMRALMALVQGETEALVSFHADAVPGSQSVLELALTTVLRRKGRIVDSLADGQTRLRAHLTPPLRQQLDELSNARGELVARLYAPAGSPSTVSAQRTAIEALRSRIDELEASLGAASDEFRTQTVPVTIAAVQAQIPADAALVELMRYQRFDPRQSQPWQEERYVAYLLTRQGPARWVALGEAKPIDAAVDAVLAAMDDRIPAKTVRTALQKLDGKLLAPIRAQLPAGVSHLIVAPDGKLNLVPFEALIDPEGRYALDSYLVSYVSSGRDLVRLGVPVQPHSPPALIAGPDYGPMPLRKDQLKFTPLAGAAAEASDLQRYFPTQALSGKSATKARLAALTGPAMVHVATHGFYGWRASSTGVAVRAPLRDVRTESLRGSMAPPPPVTHDLVDGLDQAGLAMAGANQGPAGIVTAREIAGLDWSGTQLVVLSACQTGTGAVASGDGVYGLRRALVVAGAASQVVSLWNVADASTAALMRDYYAALRQGTGRAEALRQAKRQLMRQAGYAHPFYWSAFIPAGDWRPLAATAFAPQRSTP